MQQRYYDPGIGAFLSVDPVAAREPGDNFNRYAYAFNNPYKFADPDGRENALGILARLPSDLEDPSKSQLRVQDAAQRSVDLSVEATLASGDQEAIGLAKVWNVTVDPRAAAGPHDGAAETSSRYRGSEVVSVDTFFSNQILDAAQTTGTMFSRGLQSDGADASLMALGLHELGHGDFSIRGMPSGYDKEMKASEFAARISPFSPTVEQGKVRICYECYAKK